MSEVVNRRTFLVGAGAAGSALAARPSSKAASAARVIGANDRINVGLIGSGGRGSSVARQFVRAGKDGANCQIVAVCDVYQKRVTANRDHFTKEY
ncbi:MAG: gfo/Idh/MocA family oxidoreductase, partial [Acidobacteria bacterium]|nr:gfo/Idh/MocA family oxidoreductase [Acidobacteriota bacterium]